MNAFAIRSLLLTVPAAILVQAPASAQADTSLAAFCERATMLLENRVHGEDYYTAMSMIQDCPADGPRLLAEQWVALPQDTVELRVLVDISSWVRDQRIYDAVLPVVTGTGSSRPARLAGIRVLVAYYQPCLVIAYSYNDPSGTMVRPINVGMGQWSHDVSRPGSQKLGTVRPAILEAIDTLVDSELDSVVQEVARQLSRSLRTVLAETAC